MRSSSPKILVGTLYSGENEFKESKYILNQQSYSNWDHFVIKNLPNKEAHDLLYNKFMNQASNYDFFIKLDADMVFNDNSSLEKIVSFFKERPSLDHAIFAVKDWYSDLLIQGLHVFSNRCEWKQNKEMRFVDYNPNRPGELLEVWNYPAPLVHHSPNPSDTQAFRFGIHRALKVVQREKTIYVYNQSKSQWLYLKKCWEKLEKVRDKRLAFALIGALLTLEEKIQSNVYDSQQYKIDNYLENYKEDSLEKLESIVSPVFANQFSSLKKYISSVGILRFINSYTVQKMKNLSVKFSLEKT